MAWVTPLSSETSLVYVLESVVTERVLRVLSLAVDHWWGEWRRVERAKFLIGGGWTSCLALTIAGLELSLPSPIQQRPATAKLLIGATRRWQAASTTQYNLVRSTKPPGLVLTTAAPTSLDNPSACLALVYKGYWGCCRLWADNQEPFYLLLVLVSWYNLGKLSFEVLGLVINDHYKVSNYHTGQLFVPNQIFQLDNFCIANFGPQKWLAPLVLVSGPLQALIMDQPTVFT